MKEPLRLWLIALTFFLVFALIFVISLFSMRTDSVENIYTCQEDSDCVALSKSCCGCNQGGSAIAINKIYKRQWEFNIENTCKEVKCIQIMSNHPSCFQKPACINNKCILE